MTSRIDKHFNKTVEWLTSLVLDNMGADPYKYIRHPETIVAAFEAIGFVGDYMGRYDIARLAEPAHVVLGDTPAIEDIVWVLGEVQKFREGGSRISWVRKLVRWWAWLFVSKRGYHYHGG